mmetsp:Transcript_26292/g.80856  ORF Transcript_26292/g.80856 Transcript_26292/m.80856 type:complete len:176 (+) Transcript_26292:85-612(+)
MLRSAALRRPLRHALVRRCLSSQSPKKRLTREEVEEIAERARREQKFWDAERKIFGGGISFGHPFFFVLLGSAVALHYANAKRDGEREEQEETLERLRRKVTSQRTDVDAVLAHKKRQLEVWRAKLHDPAVADEAQFRLAKLETDVAELELELQDAGALDRVGLDESAPPLESDE